MIVDEWRTMRQGEGSAAVQGWIDAMNSTIVAVAPSGTRETVGYEQWFQQDAERRRTAGADRRG